MKSLDEVGQYLGGKLRFKKFRLRVKNGRFKLEGEINPWVLLADGNLKHINEKTAKGHKLGDEVSGGILVGIKDADGGSKYVRRLDGMTENARKQEYEQLFNKELAERREQIYNALLSERVALRKDVINDIWRKAKTKIINGEKRFIDPNTKRIIPHLELRFKKFYRKKNLTEIIFIKSNK